jgi:hypothetical protein
MKRKIICGLLAVGALAMTAAPVAGAGQPTNPNCFGIGASGLGKAGAMGEHASSFGEPRLGIGNVAFALTGTHQPGELAGLLGADCG